MVIALVVLLLLVVAAVVLLRPGKDGKPAPAPEPTDSTDDQQDITDDQQGITIPEPTGSR